MLKTTRTTKNIQVHTVATTTNVYGRCPVSGSSLLSAGFFVVFILVTGIVSPRKEKHNKQSLLVNSISASQHSIKLIHVFHKSNKTGKVFRPRH